MFAAALMQSSPDAGAFLPFQLCLTQTEHSSAYFKPFATDSLLAGVGPADVHNRAPRVLPLVSSTQ